MDLMKIMDKAYELILDKLNFVMKIIVSFIVVDTLMLMIGIYRESLWIFEILKPWFKIGQRSCRRSTSGQDNSQ